jgi:hypothetical protein
MLINQALVTIGTVDFGDETSNLIYKWCSFIFLVLAYIASHWYNNDFTPEACLGTGLTRQLKAEQKDDYVGERFYTDTIEIEPDLDEEIDSEDLPVFGEFGEAIKVVEEVAEDAFNDI